MTTSRPGRAAAATSALAALVVAAVLTLLTGLLAGLLTVTAPAAQAGGLDDGLGDGLGLLASSEEPEATAEAWGKNAKLRKGCRNYRFGYAVEGSEEKWMLDLVFRDRRGRAVASAKFEGPNEPTAQRSTIRLCRASVKAGKFTVRGVLTTFEGDYTERPVPVSTFRLRR